MDENSYVNRTLVMFCRKSEFSFQTIVFSRFENILFDMILNADCAILILNQLSAITSTCYDRSLYGFVCEYSCRLYRIDCIVSKVL